MKLIIITSLIIATLVAGIWGSVLPYRKAGLYSSLSGQISQGVTLEQFKDIFSFVLDAPSPIGRDEGVKMLMSRTIDVIAQTPNLPGEIVDELLRFNESYFEPILEAETGGNFAQTIMLAGALYQSAGIVAGNMSYFEKAKEYYEEGLRYSPRRPQFLYGLFDIYGALGDSDSAKRIGDEILKYWPDSISSE